jgi:hypothetical protein
LNPFEIESPTSDIKQLDRTTELELFRLEKWAPIEVYGKYIVRGWPQVLYARRMKYDYVKVIQRKP